MSANTYTLEQILSRMRIFWKESGMDPSFDLDSHIIDYLELDFSGLGEEYDIEEIIVLLEADFEFSCPLEEWDKILSPHLTFRRLAEFIQERVKPKESGSCSTP